MAKCIECGDPLIIEWPRRCRWCTCECCGGCYDFHERDCDLGDEDEFYDDEDDEPKEKPMSQYGEPLSRPIDDSTLRQVACIEACEGVPTESLKPGIVERMREALLAALDGPDWSVAANCRKECCKGSRKARRLVKAVLAELEEK